MIRFRVRFATRSLMIAVALVGLNLAGAIATAKLHHGRLNLPGRGWSWLRWNQGSYTWEEVPSKEGHGLKHSSLYDPDKASYIFSYYNGMIEIGRGHGTPQKVIRRIVLAPRPDHTPDLVPADRQRVVDNLGARRPSGISRPAATGRRSGWRLALTRAAAEIVACCEVAQRSVAACRVESRGRPLPAVSRSLRRPSRDSSSKHCGSFRQAGWWHRASTLGIFLGDQARWIPWAGSVRWEARNHCRWNCLLL